MHWGSFGRRGRDLLDDELDVILVTAGTVRNLPGRKKRWRTRRGRPTWGPTGW